MFQHKPLAVLPEAGFWGKWILQAFSASDGIHPNQHKELHPVFVSVGKNNKDKVKPIEKSGSLYISRDDTGLYVR